MSGEHPSKPTRSILSVALTREQRAALEARAGIKPVSTYARDVLFPANDNAPLAASRSPVTVDDQKTLAQALARLGRSELGKSLREISQLAQLGALVMTPETEKAVRQGCEDLHEIKGLLMKALATHER